MTNTTITRASRNEKPTADLIAVHKTYCRIATDDELHTARSDALWLLTLADAEIAEWPDEVTLQSRLHAAALFEAVNRELHWRATRGLSRAGTLKDAYKIDVDALRQRVPVETIIGQDILLKPRGTAYAGRCPFHDDRHPSLFVWPGSGRWKCFGCNQGGDVLDWLQAFRLGRSDFRAAVAMLQDEAGVPAIELGVTPRSYLRTRQVSRG